MSLGKVKFTARGGSDSDIKDAMTLLEIGVEYTVEKCKVGSWSSTYTLERFNDIEFNTVLFDDNEVFENAKSQWLKNYFGFSKEKISED